MNSYDKLLKGSNLKVTPQRIAILSEMEKAVHIGVEELHTSVQRVQPSISLATIYKNVSVMLGAGIVREVSVPGQKPLYEIVLDSHVHFICDECCTVENIEIGTDRMLCDIADQAGREITGGNVTLFGVCADCRKAGVKPAENVLTNC